MEEGREGGRGREGEGGREREGGRGREGEGGREREGGRGRETHTGKVVAVDHDRVPAIEVDVLLPPVCDVVVGPPRLEVEVELELLTRAILRRGGEGRGEKG